MATTLSSNTFLSQYKDDYRDSDHYHRILFNNGRALQARELTQMQTIIQSEIKRIAQYLFTQASPIISSGSMLSGAFNPVGYVRVEQLPATPSEIVGLELSNTLGVKAVIKAAIPGTSGSDADDVVLVAYTTTGGQQSDDPGISPEVFRAEQELSYTLDGAQTLTVKPDVGATLAIGKGSMIETPQYDTFVAGHMIMVEAQSLVIDKFNPEPNAVVGFYLTQRILTAEDNIALYDNSGATPNLTSPGADRLQITLTLAKQSDYSGASDTFFPLYKIERGITRYVNEADNSRGVVQKTVNDRTYDIMGDFIVRRHPSGQFGLQVLSDSEADHLNYKVQGGVAFIKGSRIDRSALNLPRRVKKPRETSDYVEVSNEFTPAIYGNFLLADTINGLVQHLDSFAEVTLKSAVDMGGTTLGTARIHTINEYDNAFRLHVFDIKMDSNAGVAYNLKDARSIGTTSKGLYSTRPNNYSNYANLTLVDGVVQLHDQQDNSMLFPHPRKRVNNVDASGITLTKYKLASATTNGAGEATFTASAGATWSDPENWIVQVDSSGEIFSPPTYTGSLSNTVTITGLAGSSSGVHLYGLESKTATLKVKQLNTSAPNKSVNVTESVPIQPDGSFRLSKADIKAFKSVIDDTTGDSCTHIFKFDNGQRDYYYDVGQATLKRGYAAPASTVTVKYDYYHHTAGDLFTGYNSYNATNYEDTPTYTTAAGKHYRLTDVIDMRSVKSSDGTFSGTGGVVNFVPRSGTTISTNSVQYWQGRIDLITLKPNGYIDIKKGETSNNPVAPTIDREAEMPLHKVTLFPYTLDTTDLEIFSYENRGYSMADIRTLERRIEGVEEISALTLSELDLINSTVYDPNDPTLDRLKQGITGDGFRSNYQSQMISDEYRARLDNRGLLSPMTFVRNSTLYYDSDRSSKVMIKGSTIWPVYEEEVYINQNQASGQIDVNAFPINKFVGTGEIIPPEDSFITIKEVDTEYELGDEVIVCEEGSTEYAAWTKCTTYQTQGEDLIDTGIYTIDHT